MSTPLFKHHRLKVRAAAAPGGRGVGGRGVGGRLTGAGKDALGGREEVPSALSRGRPSRWDHTPGITEPWRLRQVTHIPAKCCETPPLSCPRPRPRPQWEGPVRWFCREVSPGVCAESSPDNDGLDAFRNVFLFLHVILFLFFFLATTTQPPCPPPPPSLRVAVKGPWPHAASARPTSRRCVPGTVGTGPRTRVCGSPPTGPASREIPPVPRSQGHALPPLPGGLLL